MTTYIIKVPENKNNLVKQLLKELGVSIKEKENKTSKEPNATTVKAIKAAREGKTSKITDIKSFFEEI